MPGHIKKKKRCLRDVEIGLDWTCSRRLYILNTSTSKVLTMGTPGVAEGLRGIRHNADPVPTAKSWEVTVCFMLVLALRLSSQGQGCRAEDILRTCSLSSPEQFLQPPHPWIVEQKLPVIFFFFFLPKESTLYTIQMANTWACNYSLPGSFRDR